MKVEATGRFAISRRCIIFNCERFRPVLVAAL